MDYIEREALRERMESVDWFHVNDTGVLIHGATSEMDSYLPTKEVYAVIENAPAADVVPVVRGRWIPDGNTVCCSECKTLGSPQWKRCPVCEAKMVGG